MKTRIVQNTPEEPREPPHHPRTNLAGRMGRWSAHHRKTAIFGWLGFVVVAFVVGNVIGATKIDNNTSGVGESGRADRILDAGFQQPAGETVLIQSRTVDANDPAFKAVVADVVAKVLGVRLRRTRPLAGRSRQRGPDFAERSRRAGRLRYQGRRD